MEVDPRFTAQAPRRRGGRRPEAGAKPSTIEGFLDTLPPDQAERERKYIDLLIVNQLKKLRRRVRSIGRAATSARAQTPAASIGQSGRGGRRPGAGRKPSTIIGLISSVPSRRAEKLRMDLEVTILKKLKVLSQLEISALHLPATPSARGGRRLGAGRKPTYPQRRRGGRPRHDAKRNRVIQLKGEGRSWRQIQIVVNRETGENLTADAYRRLARNRRPE